MTDTIRTSLEWILQQLIEAEATSVIGAGLCQRSESRTAQRNGHRPRLQSTTAGDVELKTPKPRAGSFFPSLPARLAPFRANTGKRKTCVGWPDARLRAIRAG